MSDTSGKLGRWRLRLSEFKFDIIHRVGIKHQTVAVLSRLLTAGIDTTKFDDEVPVLYINPENSRTGKTSKPNKKMKNYRNTVHYKEALSCSLQKSSQ